MTESSDWSSYQPGKKILTFRHLVLVQNNQHVIRIILGKILSLDVSERAQFSDRLELKPAGNGT